MASSDLALNNYLILSPELGILPPDAFVSWNNAEEAGKGFQKRNRWMHVIWEANAVWKRGPAGTIPFWRIPLTFINMSDILRKDMSDI